MQTNHNYGAIVGLALIVLVGAILLGSFVAGAFDPEKQAAANRVNAEVEYLKGKYAQELAASQAEMEATIANAPAMAQLAVTQKQHEIQLASDIRKVGMICLLLVAAAGLIVAIAHLASKTAAARQPSQRTASPSQPPQRPMAVGPRPQSTTTNGQADPRRATRATVIESEHATITLLARRVANTENQIAALGQQLTDIQATLQGLTALPATQARLVKTLDDIQTDLEQLESQIRTLDATRTQHNGQGWHAIDVRETYGPYGSPNGTYIHPKEVIGPQSTSRRKAA